MRILILGGTTEASALARALAPSLAPSLASSLADEPRFEPVLSLAGRTRSPVLPPIPARRGGFGGAEGLARYLRSEAIAALIDATHPFARIISANAAAAASATGIPRLALQRPPWRPTSGDRWQDVATMEEAAAALGEAPRRVFLTVGQQELAPFRTAPQHAYLIRSVEPPDPAALPPRSRCITARGPFEESDERRLLQEIDVLVTKNSGGSATAPKLAAARALGLPVIMVRRPPAPEPPVVATVGEALGWLHHAALRGV